MVTQSRLPQRSNEQIEDESQIPSTTIKRKPAPKVVGLANLGNTCFMNAALQCLARTPNLLDRLLEFTKNPELKLVGSDIPQFNKNKNNNNNNNNEEDNAPKELILRLDIPTDSMIYKMTELLKKMTSGGATVVPSAVHNVVCSAFTAGMQHDSHELLRNIIDKMKKDQVRAIRVALLKSMGHSTKEAKCLQDKDPQKAEQLKELDRLFATRTVVDEIFGGQLMTIKTCLECNAVRSSFEDFLDLSLPLRVDKPNTSSSTSSNATTSSYSYSNPMRSSWQMQVPSIVNKTLRDCFKCFTEPETLAGSNSVDCDNCHEIKLNLIKQGVPIHEVFPPPPTPPPTHQKNQRNNININIHKNNNNNNNNTNNTNKNKKGKLVDQQQQQQKGAGPSSAASSSSSVPLQSNQSNQRNPRRKKKMTRAEKIAADQENVPSTSPSTTTTNITSGINTATSSGNSSSSTTNNNPNDDDDNDNNVEMDQNEKIDTQKIESSSSPSDSDMPDLEKLPNNNDNDGGIVAVVVNMEDSKEKVPDEGFAEDYNEGSDNSDEEEKGTEQKQLNLFEKRDKTKEEIKKEEQEKLSKNNMIDDDDEMDKQSVEDDDDAGGNDAEVEDDDDDEEENISKDENKVKINITKDKLSDNNNTNNNNPAIPKSTKSPCRRQTLISKPPNNLTIQLKRFTVGIRGTTCKLSDFVKFPEYMNIRDFVTIPIFTDNNINTNCNGSSSTATTTIPTTTTLTTEIDADSCDTAVNSSNFEMNNKNMIFVNNSNITNNNVISDPISSWEFDESDEMITNHNSNSKESKPNIIGIRNNSSNLGGGARGGGGDTNEVLNSDSIIVLPHSSLHSDQQQQNHQLGIIDTSENDVVDSGITSSMLKNQQQNIIINTNEESELQDLSAHDDFDFYNTDKDFDSHGEEVPMSPRISPLLHSDSEQSPNDNVMSMLEHSNITNEDDSDTNMDKRMNVDPHPLTTNVTATITTTTTMTPPPTTTIIDQLNPVESMDASDIPTTIGENIILQHPTNHITPTSVFGGNDPSNSNNYGDNFATPSSYNSNSNTLVTWGLPNQHNSTSSTVWTFNEDENNQSATGKWVQEVSSGMETSHDHDDDIIDQYNPFANPTIMDKPIGHYRINDDDDDINRPEKELDADLELDGEKTQIISENIVPEEEEDWDLDTTTTTTTKPICSNTNINNYQSTATSSSSLINNNNNSPASYLKSNVDTTITTATSACDEDIVGPSTSSPLKFEEENSSSENFKNEPIIALGYYPSTSASSSYPSVVENENDISILDNDDITITEDGKPTTKESLLCRFNGETEDPEGIRYRLYGIVEHSGNIHWGHYVAYVRSDEEWYYISDSYVNRSKLSDVLSRCPYMLFYERVL